MQIMKLRLQYISLLACCVSMLSCEKDNYDAPSNTLSGKLVYQGQTFGVEKDQVPYQLFQFGFGKVGPIGSSFTQEGTYSALLFNGTYKLIIPNGQGPFLWKKTPGGAPDSLTISLNGNQVLDLEVTPYYLVKDAQVTGGSGKVNAAFKIAKIITDASAKEVENVRLYINKTQFVSAGNNIANANIDGGAIADPNNVNLSVTVPAMTPTQNYVYARVGLKIKDVEDRIYSPLVKIQL
jgi:hypothetical protein